MELAQYRHFYSWPVWAVIFGLAEVVARQAEVPMPQLQQVRVSLLKPIEEVQFGHPLVSREGLRFEVNFTKIAQRSLSPGRIYHDSSDH